MAWPNTLPARADLQTPVNNFAVALVTAISPLDTSFQLTAWQVGPAVLPSRGFISVDREVIYYDSYIQLPGGFAQLVNCTRGADGTVAAGHVQGAKAELRWVAGHHNGLADLLHAVAASIGAGILDGSGQHPDLAPLNFPSLLAMLSQTLPKIVRFDNAINWSTSHNRGRVVGVQCYEYSLVDDAFQEIRPVVMQRVPNPGVNGVCYIDLDDFDAPKSGFMVIL